MAKHLVMVIDLERCVGCWTCAVACKAENNVALGNWWNRITSPDTNGPFFAEPGKGPDGKPALTFMPLQCNHCDNPACVRACPTGASHKRPDGIVAIDYDKCIGCRTCMAACPYNVRVFNWRDPLTLAGLENDHMGSSAVPVRPKGVVEKCTFCVERIDRGELPACVEACPVQTRTFGDLNDPNSDVARLIHDRNGKPFRPEFGTEPNVYYLPPRRHRSDLLLAFGEPKGETV
jgi:dimethyl sulfoxide reductase iron-sulfur subunit